MRADQRPPFFASRGDGSVSWSRRLEGRPARLVLATGVEAGLYREICPEACVESIPNGVDLDHFRPLPEVGEEAYCVFVGQLDYRANVLGLEWFCRTAWPAIRASPGRDVPGCGP